MNINPSVHLKQTQAQAQVQKLAMTQNMQQSLQMLHYNTAELIEFLQEKTFENPLISIKIENDPNDVPACSKNKPTSEDKHQAFLEQVPSEKVSLFEHLLAQVHLNYRDTFLRQVLIYLVDYIDANGYLRISLDIVMKHTKASEVEVIDALTLLQQLDPPGVGARDLQECLMLQTERDKHAPDLAYLILEEQFDQLVNRKWETICHNYDLTLCDVQIVFDYIQTLTPHPGSLYSQTTAQFIIPDLTVTLDNDSLNITSSKEYQPRIIFQQKYFNRYKDVDDKELQDYLKQRQQEFDWLKTTVEKRGDTILRIGTEILKRQTNFFIDPHHPLIPLTLKEIATELDLHESTISRAVNQKYMRTPFGIYELKYFFTQGINRQSTGEIISSLSVKSKLQQLVETEDKQHPLSDQKIADLLSQSDLSISRRTVVKYRNALGIPASSKRKRY